MIGFFGGTFDPIHFGHLNLALRLREKAGLKEVWFCPAYVSPFKTSVKSASPEDRYEMVKLAIEGIEGFKVLDTEIKKKAPSYTIDTLRELISETNETFRLIIGSDQEADFMKWKEAEALKILAPPLMGERAGSPSSSALPLPLFDISATEIRERVKEGLYVGHQIPQAVQNYILKNKLYQ